MTCPTYDQRYSLDFFLLNNHKRQELRINCLFNITYIRRTRQYTNYISVLNVAFKVNINPVSILEVRVGCSRITPITVLFFSHVTIVCGLWSCNTYQESWHKGFILRTSLTSGELELHVVIIAMFWHGSRKTSITDGHDSNIFFWCEWVNNKYIVSNISAIS
jgi:hypothetical protein